MLKLLMLLLPLLPLLLAACGTPEPAELVLKGGLVLTVDPAHPRAQAVAIRAGKIVAVGSDAEIGRYVREGVTEVLELEGRLVVPGFNDAHTHIFSVGAALEKVDLAGVAGLEEFARRVGERVKTLQPGEWVIGRGWDQGLLPGGQWPTREVLDRVAPDHPVLLSRVDSHSLLVNSIVLRASGITRDTPDPEGGEIVRDADGEPTGVLKENAMGLVHQPEQSPEEQRRDNLRHLRAALAEARRLGVTSITYFNDGLAEFEELAAAGELTLRVDVGLPLTDQPDQLAHYRELRARWRDDPLIRIGALKGFIDGTLGSSTAAMLEPYSDNPESRGTLVMSAEELAAQVAAADRDSFQVAIHAIGDRGVRLALDAIEAAREANGARDSRHRVEHIQVLDPQDLPRFAALGAVASMQPTHCISDKRYAGERIGAERCRLAYPWHSVLASGARLAFGTDCPIEPLDPLLGLYAAVTRKRYEGEEGPGWVPEQKLTMEQALEAYTLGAAYAEFQEQAKGSITPGKYADLAVLSQNLLETPEPELLATRVVATIFDGKLVYRNF